MGASEKSSKVATVSGLKVSYQATSTASLWEAAWTDLTPVPLPEQMPQPVRRGPRLAILVHQLLDSARPAQFTAWQLFTLGEQGPSAEGLPFAIGITCADGSRVLLRVNATGAQLGREPDDEPFPDWRIPADLSAS